MTARVISELYYNYIWNFFKVIMKHYVQMSLNINNDIERDNIYFIIKVGYIHPE